MGFHSEHPLPHGNRRDLSMAGGAHHVSHTTLCADLVDIDPRPGEGVLHSAAGSGDCADRCIHIVGPVSLLLLLGSDVDPDGAADWHFRA